MAEPKPTGLFSSLSLGRAAKSPRSSETLAHPLLGASTSSLNLNTDIDPTSPVGHGSSPSHPILSPKASSTFSRTPAESLPYKPRQRHTHRDSSSSFTGTTSPVISAGVTPAAPTAPPTTSTSSTFALPPSASEGMSSETSRAGPSSGSATSRLQVQSLKASAQRLGLANGSIGMAMVDAVVDKGQVARSGSRQGEGGEWGDILRVLTSGKAILLLPAASASSLPMTAPVMREHIAFLSPPIHLSPMLPSQMRSSDSLAEKARDAAGETVSMVVTLSGLMDSGTVTFESILQPDSHLLAALRDPVTRPGVLATLRPTTLALRTAFPSYPLSSQSASLAFPPLGRPIGGPIDTKDQAQDTKASAAKLGRMNPFASFFGSSSQAATSTRDTSARAGATRPTDQGTLMVSRFDLSPNSGSPAPSILSVENADDASVISDATSRDAEGFSVQAYTVAKPIRTSEVQKALSKAVRAHVKDELARLPDKIADRVAKLVLASICPGAGTTQDALTTKLVEPDSTPSIDFTDPARASEQLQDFLEAVYDDLVVHYRNDSSLFVAEGGLRRKSSGGKPWGRSSGSNGSQGTEEELSKEIKDKRRREREEQAEKEGTEGAERVEALVTRLLYNRLFSPLNSDDGRHDEALASRIAALNMLELSLDHLGLITRPDDEEVPGRIAGGLASIVDKIGDELQQLITPSCLVPRAKADVLIRAHQLVVDGLADLPPVQLRPEGEPYKPSPAISQAPTLEADPSPVTQSSSSLLLPPTAEKPADVPAPAEDIEISETSQLEEALGDSVMTLHAASMSPSGSMVAQPSEVPAPRPAPKQSTSGADLILPIIIFAVVQANPPQLASQLMYLRRYRSAICLTGEASYAMVNLTAVVEFLEHVDLAELGLGGESDKVMSVADLSPIGLNYLDESNPDAQSIASASSRLRGRVFQVGELAGSAAGSANKVITGVIDSSWSAVRGLIGTTAVGAEDDRDSTTTGATRPATRGRQVSSFSLANVTASVANIAAAAAATTQAAARSRASSRAVEPPPTQQWQGNQEMIDVISRPQSIKEHDKEEYPSDSESDSADTEGSAENRPDPFTAGRTDTRALSDARSIKSVSSMLSKEGRRDDAARVSLSDRLANIGGFGRVTSGSGPVTPAETPQVPSPEKESAAKPTGFLASLTGARSSSSTGQGHSRRASLLSGNADITGRLRANSGSSPSGAASLSRTSSVLPADPPPNPVERFMTCDLGDLKMSEIGELLKEYQRLGAYVKSRPAGEGAGVSSSASNTS